MKRYALPVLAGAFLAARCGASPASPSTSPRLTATRFVAFGDSETAGKLNATVLSPSDIVPTSYVAVLYSMLTQRYAGQSIDMFSVGTSGQQVQGGPSPDGVSGLPLALDASAPQVLLLLEGVNDLNAGDSIQSLVDGLTTMVRTARGRGIVVFLGTLAPERAGGPNAFAPTLIAPANMEIRAMAGREGAILVDLYAAFGGSPDPWIGADGLHPTAAGYEQIAHTFYVSILANLDSSLAPPRP